MRIPHMLLRELIAVQDFAGSGAHGPRYAPSREIRAAMQPTSRLVADETGRTVTVDTVALVRPEAGPIVPQSRVTHGSTTYRVIQSVAMPDTRRPTHWELALQRYAG